jgi:hypothetical protein
MISVLNRNIDRVTVEGEDSSSLSDIFGRLVRERRFSVSDPDGVVGNYSDFGILRAGYRNVEITETNTHGDTVFVGVINDAGYFRNREGARLSVITAREPFGNLIDWYVETGTLISGSGLASYYTTDASAIKGQTQIILTATGTPAIIPAGSYISFGNFSVPRYYVIESNGTPTQNIVLDRALEVNAPSQIVRCITPIERTVAAEIRATLEAAGLTTKIGDTFRTLDVSDTAAGYLGWFSVRQESKRKLSEYVTKLLEMFDCYLTVSDSGAIDIYRGLAFDYQRPSFTITDKEIVGDVKIQNDKSRLFWAYDCLYKDADTIGVNSGTVTPATLAAYAASQRFQPIPARSSSINDYTELYANSATATYFGERVMNYYSVPRARLTCGVKPAISGNPSKKINLTLGTRVTVQHKISNRQTLNEPAIVVAATFDRKERYYTSVTFELCNFLYPGLSV